VNRLLERRYRLPGVSVQVNCDSEVLSESVEGLLRSFAKPAPSGNGDDSHAWRASARSVADASELPRRRSSAAALAFEQPRVGLDGSSWGYAVWRDQGRTIIEVLDRGLVVIEPKRRCAEVWAVAPERWAAEEREGLVFLLASEVLRATRVYPLHAAAVERDGRAVLILGSSGAGKSTSLLSLMQAGWRCLSDDHPLICDTTDGPRVLSWPARLELTAETARLVGGLSEVRVRTGERKLWLYPEELGAGVAGASAAPVLLLFPKVVDWPVSSVEAVSSRFALEELLRLGMVVVDRETAAHQFSLLARLARESARARLFFGSDVERLPALVDRLLDTAAA
jgi:hypothetical protein